MKTIDEMSTKELEQFLAKKKKAEKDRVERERQQYEKGRDEIIQALMEEGMDIAGQLQRFKSKVEYIMTEQAVKLDQYGQLRGNSKGGFSIMDKAGSLKIIRRLDSEPTWDERAGKGVELIKSFLFDTVKKRDKNLFEILLSFLERNKKGDLEYSKVFSLMQHEGKYSDERWVEGLRLLKEGYQIYHKGFGYEFKVKRHGDKWENVVLNFSSI